MSPFPPLAKVAAAQHDPPAAGAWNLPPPAAKPAG